MVLCFHCSINAPFFLQEGFTKEHSRLTGRFRACTEAFLLQPQPIYNLSVLQATHSWSWPERNHVPACHHWRGQLPYPGTTLALPFPLHSTAKSQDKVGRMALEMKRGKGAKWDAFRIDRDPLMLTLKGEIKDACLFLLEMCCLFYSSGLSPKMVTWWIWGRIETKRLSAYWKQNFNSSLIITKRKDGCPDFLGWKWLSLS